MHETIVMTVVGVSPSLSVPLAQADRALHEASLQ
jgi:hypothetical protein